MFLSVIMPVYNGEKTVARAIDSVLSQSFEDFELIIVNDGSKDGTRKILEGYQDKRIRLYHQKNAGASMARNCGIDHAKGRFVAFVDADDTLPEDAYRYLHQIAVTQGGDMIVGQYERMEGASTYDSVRMKSMTETVMIPKNDVNMLYCMSCCNRWYNAAILREHKVRFVPREHMEDAVFNYEFLQYTNSISTCPHVVYTYIKPLASEGTSVTRSVNRKLLEKAQVNFDTMERLTQSYGTLFRDTLHFRFMHSIYGNVYYRQFWKLDKKSRGNISAVMEDLYQKLNPEDQEKFSMLNHDIFRDGSMFSTQDYLTHPLFTIAVKDISPKHMEAFLACLYDQSEPSFELWIDHRLKSHVPWHLRRKENISFYKNDVFSLALEKGAGRYVTFVEDDVFYELRSLQDALKELEEDPELFGVSEKPVRFTQREMTRIDCMEALYDEGHEGFDLLLSNKIFSMEALRTSGFSFEKTKEERIEILRDMKIGKLSCPAMLMDVSEESICAGLSSEQKALKPASSVSEEEETKEADGEKSLSKQYREEYLQDYYLNETVKKGTVLIIPEDDTPTSFDDNLIAGLLSGEYGKYKVCFLTSKIELDSVREHFQKAGLGDVELRIRGRVYHKKLANVETIIAEKPMPYWWIKKPGQHLVSLWRQVFTEEYAFTRQRSLFLSDCLYFASEEIRKEAAGELMRFLPGKIFDESEEGRSLADAVCQCFAQSFSFEKRGIKPVILLSKDLNPEGLCTLHEMEENGKFYDRLCLAAFHYMTDESGNTDEALAQKLPVLWFRGISPDSYMARKYWLGDFAPEKLVILDCDNTSIIRSVARFPEPVVLIVNEALFQKAKEGDDRTLFALRVFRRAGDGIYINDKEKAKVLSDILNTEVEYLEGPEDLEKILLS